NKTKSDDQIDMGGPLEIFDKLSAEFHSAHRSEGHQAAKLVINVAEITVLLRRHDGFPDDVGEVGPHDKIHGHAKSKQSGTRQKTSAYSKETPKYADDKPNQDQPGGSNMRVRDGKIHFRGRCFFRCRP